MDSQVPDALVVVHTFIVAPPTQVAPFTQVVPPLTPELLPDAPPLLVLPPLLVEFPPLVPVPSAPDPPPVPSGLAAPEHATRTPSAPIHAKPASLMSPPTFRPARISLRASKSMWTRSDAIAREGRLFRRSSSRDPGILESRR
jgi:hypothetical protein